MKRDFFKWMGTQDLYGSVERAGELELFVKDGDEEVNTQCDPDLSFHGVGAGAVVMFDSEVLLDPAEEQFDAPTQTIEAGDSQGLDVQVVGRKSKWRLFSVLRRFQWKACEDMRREKHDT